MNNKDYIFILLYNNITFCLISIKLFYILDNKPINTKYYKPEYKAKNDDIIVIDIFRPINTPKQGRGQLYKAFNISIFL